jgi:predicted MFS family arabinose efflux permease
MQCHYLHLSGKYWSGPVTEDYLAGISINTSATSIGWYRCRFCLLPLKLMLVFPQLPPSSFFLLPSHAAAASIAVTSTGFQVSHKLRSATEKQALALAVKDAIANIGQSASPWLGPTELKSFSPGSLGNVRISTKPNS